MTSTSTTKRRFPLILIDAVNDLSEMKPTSQKCLGMWWIVTNHRMQVMRWASYMICHVANIDVHKWARRRPSIGSIAKSHVGTVCWINISIEDNHQEDKCLVAWISKCMFGMHQEETSLLQSHFGLFRVCPFEVIDSDSIECQQWATQSSVHPRATNECVSALQWELDILSFFSHQ